MNYNATYRLTTINNRMLMQLVKLPLHKQSAYLEVHLD